MGEPDRYLGTLLAESLLLDSVVEAASLTVTKLYRAAAGDTDAGRPRDWTFIEFSLSATSVDQLVAALIRSLKTEGGWYCDFHSGSEVVVVFANRVFRYAKGDRASRSAAKEYGRSVGVPEAQLDWSE